MSQTEICDYQVETLGSGYFVRIDEHEAYAEIIKNLSEIHPDFHRIFAMRHVGKFKENPHFHLVITTVIKLQTFRVRMKKLFTKGTGNGHMSIKVWDGDEKALSYLFHEEDPYIIVQYGYSDEDVARFIEADKEVKADYQKAKKEVKSSRQALINLVIASLGKEYPPYLERKVSLQHNVVAFCVWDVCKDNQINLPHKFNLEFIIRQIQMHFSHSSRTAWYGTKDMWYTEMFSFRN